MGPLINGSLHQQKKYANKSEIFVATSTVAQGFSQHPKMFNKLKTVE
jgi:hypothetical protein